MEKYKVLIILMTGSSNWVCVWKKGGEVVEPSDYGKYIKN